MKKNKKNERGREEKNEEALVGFDYFELVSGNSKSRSSLPSQASSCVKSTRRSLSVRSKGKASNKNMMKLLLNCNIHVNARCLKGSTILDIVTDESRSVNTEMKDLLIRAGALQGHSNQMNDTATTSMKQLSFKSRLTLLENVIRFLKGQKTNISTESRDALLVVAALVATATFQAVLSPPGGLRQAGSTDSDSLPFSKVGKVVMKDWLYIIFLILNRTSFWVTIIAIFLLLPNGFYGRLLTLPLALLSDSYLFSSTVISPSLIYVVVNFDLFTLFIILLLGLVLLSNRQLFLHIRKLWPRSR